MSSGLGSLTRNSDPDREYAQYKFLGYNASKPAVNMLTVQLAAELRDSGIKVNSADPGFTATDLNNHRGYQTTTQGAAAAIRLALLPDDGPTGGFFSASRGSPGDVAVGRDVAPSRLTCSAGPSLVRGVGVFVRQLTDKCGRHFVNGLNSDAQRGTTCRCFSLLRRESISPPGGSYEFCSSTMT
jgi:hypothetical protein